MQKKNDTTIFSIHDKTQFEKAAVLLCEKDSVLAAIHNKYGFPRIAFRKPGFASLVYIILEQQVSLAAAAAVNMRLNDLIDPLTPDSVLNAGEQILKQAGLSRQKIKSVLALSAAIKNKQLVLENLPEMNDTEAMRQLQEVHGIGTWTAEIYLMMVLGKTDYWPVKDRALQVAFEEHYGLELVPANTTAQQVSEAWRPYRSVAAFYLWHAYRKKKGIKLK